MFKTMCVSGWFSGCLNQGCQQTMGRATICGSLWCNSSEQKRTCCSCYGWLCLAFMNCLSSIYFLRFPASGRQLPPASYFPLYGMSIPHFVSLVGCTFDIGDLLATSSHSPLAVSSVWSLQQLICWSYHPRDMWKQVGAYI